MACPIPSLNIFLRDPVTWSAVAFPERIHPLDQASIVVTTLCNSWPKTLAGVQVTQEQVWMLRVRVKRMASSGEHVWVVHWSSSSAECEAQEEAAGLSSAPCLCVRHCVLLQVAMGGLHALVEPGLGSLLNKPFHGSSSAVDVSVFSPRVETFLGLKMVQGNICYGLSICLIFGAHQKPFHSAMVTLDAWKAGKHGEQILFMALKLRGT